MMSDPAESDIWDAQSTHHPWIQAGLSPQADSPADALDASSSVSDGDRYLRQRVTQLIPLEGALGYLAALREPAPLERPEPPSPTANTPSSASYLEDLDRLRLESPSANAQQSLDTAISLKQQSLESLFWHLVPPALGDRRELEPLIEQMSDRFLRQEAQMQRAAIATLSEQLPQTSLKSGKFDVFGHEAQSLLGILLDIERRQRVIERLVLRDRTLPGSIITFSILYSLIAAVLVVLFVVFWGQGLVVGGVSEQKLPLIGIPWPVFVWSLFGSLAAILARFLYHPFRRLREMTQWMLLRPIQGIVFGGASYFVLDSLLSLLTPQFTPLAPLPMTDEAILLLSFVVGFSDRFGAIVFRWMSETESQNR